MFAIIPAFGEMRSIADFFGILLIACVYLVPAILLTVVSFQPYWQINRIYYTGKAGWFETLVIWWGKITVALVKWSWRIMWWIIRFILSFV